MGIPAWLPKLCSESGEMGGSPMSGGAPSPLPKPNAAQLSPHPQSSMCSKDPCFPASWASGTLSLLLGRAVSQAVHCAMPEDHLVGPVNHSPATASALLSVLCTHLSIFTQQAVSTDVLNQWTKHICFPKQNFSLLPRLAVAAESRVPRGTTGMLDTIEGGWRGLCGR